MATGDVTIRIAIEGSTAKAVTLGSQIRLKSQGRLLLENDDDWAVKQLNRFAEAITTEANRQLDIENPVTHLTFVAAE